jgi:RHS repeat-associated protein
MSVGDDSYLFVKNLQGDIVKIIDEDSNVLATYSYDAWGKVYTETEDSSIAGLNPFTYRGYVYDPETELYYLQSRYYDPLTGRFINADAPEYTDTYSGSPLSTNMFAYCENNAVMRIDASGNDAVLLFKNDDAVIFGHAAILFYDKNSWYYFCVVNKGEESKMEIEFGKIGAFTLSMKSINKAIKNAKKRFTSKKYDSYYYLVGNFKLYSSAYKYYKKPGKYNLVSRNCLTMSQLLLSKGSCKGIYKNYYRDAINMLSLLKIPNDADFAFSYFTKNFRSCYTLPFYKRLFIREPYYYFYHPVSTELWY